MDDNQLLRYSRHILLPQIDIQGQEILLNSSALIIGAGGLGSPVAMYLAASGVGKLMICDHDVVDLTNLQRQIIHNTNAVGTPKTLSAKKTLAGINPDVAVVALNEYVDDNTLQQLVAEADLVIDASDNFSTPLCSRLWASRFPRTSTARACWACPRPTAASTSSPTTATSPTAGARSPAGSMRTASFSPAPGRSSSTCARIPPSQRTSSKRPMCLATNARSHWPSAPRRWSRRTGKASTNPCSPTSSPWATPA